jgi:hypothetical protein
MSTETTASQVPTVELNDGQAIPQLGFGALVAAEDTASPPSCGTTTTATTGRAERSSSLAALDSGERIGGDPATLG